MGRDEKTLIYLVAGVGGLFLLSRGGGSTKESKMPSAKDMALPPGLAFGKAFPSPWGLGDLLPLSYSPSGTREPCPVKRGAPFPQDSKFVDSILSYCEGNSKSGKKYNPDTIMTAIGHECMFNPEAQSNSGCTGIVQFCGNPANAWKKKGGVYQGGAKGLLTRTLGFDVTGKYIASLSLTEQIPLMDIYLAQFDLPDYPSLEDLYFSIFAPKCIGKSDSYDVYVAPSGAYEANAKWRDKDDDGIVDPGERGVDSNADGKITCGEIATRIRATYKRGKSSKFRGA